MENHVLKLINQRYTVKSFTSELVPEDMVQKILSAAEDAPSKQNKYPYRLYVLDNRSEKARDLRKKLYDHTACDITLGDKPSRFYQNEILTAPVSVLATTKPILEDWEQGQLNEKASTMRSTRDAMMSIIFMLLQAQEFELGTACTGCFAEGIRNINQFRKDFSLPDDEFPCIVLNFGFPDPAMAKDKVTLPQIPRHIMPNGETVYSKSLTYIDENNPELGVTDPVNTGPSRKMQPKGFITFI